MVSAMFAVAVISAVSDTPEPAVTDTELVAVTSTVSVNAANPPPTITSTVWPATTVASAALRVADLSA